VHRRPARLEYDGENDQAGKQQTGNAREFPLLA
jgi:hypothetical protein